MIRQVLLIVILSLFLTSCGGGAAATEAPAATEEPAATEAPATEEPAATEAPTQSVIEIPASPEPLPLSTSTPAPTQTPAITQTETSLPTLDLPTEMVNAPARMAWDGTPTYLGDSTPGYAFRVFYDPDLWAVTSDQFGFPALAHRNISNCIISVTAGRGLPPNITVEHDVLYTDTVTFDVGIAYENGVKKFVTYTGGDGNIITAFEVSFQNEVDACIADAVTVLSTLESVPASQSTPTPTP